MAIKVLVLDDSHVFREIISRGIESDVSIKVVAKAIDPYDAIDKIMKFEPDVITCDIEMPKMNGIEFIRKLMPQHPVPIIVVSTVTDKVFDAMDAGAVEFVSKPSAQTPESVENFLIELINKIKVASKAKVVSFSRVKENSNPVTNQIVHHEIIGIGASTGGTEAIFKLLRQLPKKMPGIVIVQHIPPVFSKMFAERLNQQTHFKVKEAENNDMIKNNHVYLAPGNQHMQVVKERLGYSLKVFSGEKVSGYCPSVDVLFLSMAEQVGNKCIGVILTGMGYDGAKGIASMKRKGAVTLGQDEASSVVYGMPKVAYELNGIVKQCSLDLMGDCITKFLR